MLPLRAKFEGGTLRILFVHGMGRHQPGYSQALMQESPPD